MNDHVTLTDDERALGVAHADWAYALVFTQYDVERILAARLAQVTADRDRWKMQRDSVFRGFKTALVERDEARKVVEAMRAQADEWERLADGNEIARGSATKVAGYYRRCAAQVRALLAPTEEPT